MAVTKKELAMLMQTYKQLRAMREPYLVLWKKVSRWIDPWYGNMDMDSNPGVNPLPAKTDLYDSTVGWYSQVFSTGLQGYTCSSQSAFFELTTERQDGSEDEEQGIAKILQARTRKMYKVLASSGFYSAIHNFFKSFGDLGTGIMMFGVNADNKIYYEYVPNYTCIIMEDKTINRVDTLFRTIWMTKYETKKSFNLKDDELPEAMKEDRNDPTKKYKFIQLICPRDRFELSLSNEYRYVELVWLEESPEKTIFEGGSDYLRFAVCPFAKGFDGTGWGIGAPGLRQFSSSHTLQNMSRDQMNASQLLSAPPMKKTDNVHAEIRPGGFITIPPGGDIAPLQLGADLSWTNAMRLDLRNLAKADYFVDYFLMLSQYSGNVNTATLAQGLQNEQLKMMTFFLDNLKETFFEPVIDWTWNTMGKLGLFNEEGVDISYDKLQVDYISPLYRLQKQAVSLEPTINAMNIILPYIQIDPTLINYIDFSGYVQAVSEGTGADARVIRNKAEAEKLIMAQAEAERQKSEAEQRIKQQEADTRSYEATQKAPEQGSLAQEEENSK